jgi:glycosyltransferase involved in cell wall biosynthesis
LVSIGTFAPWHGWDKVLYALANIKNNNDVFNIKYYIIGDGVELKNLTILCNKLNLQDYVFFLGTKKREDYVNIINRCNLGVGSLAWERVGVKVASPLKNREYISCGIPVVYNAFDIDISNSGFGFEINSDLESIQTFFNWFIDFNDPKDKNDYYNFAKEKLDMDIKFKSILMNL